MHHAGQRRQREFRGLEEDIGGRWDRAKAMSREQPGGREGRSETEDGYATKQGGRATFGASEVDRKNRTDAFEQDGWNKSEKVYEEYQSEIFRWNNERMEMEARLSDLDTEVNGYERTVEAVTKEEVFGGFDWDVAERIVQIRDGRKQEREARESAKQAEEVIIGLMEVRRQARAKERGLT
jgi:hypothetical protein